MLFKKPPADGTPVQPPDGWQPHAYIDLTHNRQQAIFVNLLSLALMALMFALGIVINGFSTGMLNSGMLWQTLLGIGGIVAYIFAHEAVHGVFMKLFSHETPFFGMSAMYAYAGSDSMFGKRDYLIIAFAPVVLLGLILLAANMALGSFLFWPVFAVQMVNVSGAAGDFYVGARILRMPGEIGIIDRGTDMTIFTRG